MRLAIMRQKKKVLVEKLKIFCPQKKPKNQGWRNWTRLGKRGHLLEVQADSALAELSG